jgi:hypothetical protein
MTAVAQIIEDEPEGGRSECLRFRSYPSKRERKESPRQQDDEQSRQEERRRRRFRHRRLIALPKAADLALAIFATADHEIGGDSAAGQAKHRETGRRSADSGITSKDTDRDAVEIPVRVGPADSVLADQRPNEKARGFVGAVGRRRDRLHPLQNSR